RWILPPGRLWEPQLWRSAPSAQESPRCRLVGSFGLGRCSRPFIQDENRGGGRDGPLRQEFPSFDYWSSFRTACSLELDCAKAAMPVCSRIWYLDMFATTCPIFASWMPLREEDRFCEVLFMTSTAAFI